MVEGLHWIDWLVVAGFLLVNVAIGLYFTRRAGKNIESFFISNRALPWYVAGLSLTIGGFASDTPLWISTLIRRYGIHYTWQWLAPFIGVALAAVLFARLWRRMRIVTDVEFLEIRYSGKAAGTLRFWEGASQAILLCPLIIGWVTKSMEVITRETMGLSPEWRIWTTVGVSVMAVIMCAFSGLFGVAYTAVLQFAVATIGSLVLAGYALYEVGGFGSMVEKLSALEGVWPGYQLNIAPNIGSEPHQMSVWNAIGYFGILWWFVALSGKFEAQKLLACKDGKNATFAMLLHGILHRCLVCWPWVIVGACSLIVLPTLGEGVSDDVAYPRMLVVLLPIGLRGLMVAALIAAFISTISALFTWGSSYIVNDIYKRFMFQNATDKHYVLISRLMTILLAVVGGAISFLAEEILQLTTAAYVIWSGIAVIGILRWFWPRLTALGDLCATFAVWIVAPLMLFGRVFDAPARHIFGLDASVELSRDMEFLGARMFIAALTTAITAVVVSLVTKKTDPKQLQTFVMRAKPFKVFWKRVIDQLDEPYQEHETLGRTLLTWLIVCLGMCSLIIGMGKLLFGSPLTGILCLIVFVVMIWITVQRINQDFEPRPGREETI